MQVAHQNSRMLQIDFAPMVDLGFLLITFFVFTTQLQEPQVMALHVPDDGDTFHATQAPLSTTLTLQLGAGGEIQFFEGGPHHFLASGKAWLNGTPSLRTLLLDKQRRIRAMHGTDKHYTVIIQPGNQSHYRELVGVLDELQIAGIKKMALVD